eukprot:1090402-Rhodomonas_salina.1
MKPIYACEHELLLEGKRDEIAWELCALKVANLISDERTEAAAGPGECFGSCQNISALTHHSSLITSPALTHHCVQAIPVLTHHSSRTTIPVLTHHCVQAIPALTYP